MKASPFDVPFYKEHLEDKKGLSACSVDHYMFTIMDFLKHNPDIDELEPYNEYIIKNAIKKRKTYCFSHLKSFIEYIIKDAATRNKLVEGLIRPPVRNDIVMERKYLSEEKIIEVINHLEYEKHKIVALIQMLTGVRAGDIMKVEKGGIVPEIYMGKEVLRINVLGKRRKRNVVYIHDKIAHVLIMNYITTHPGSKDYYFLEYGTTKNREGNYNNKFLFYRMNYRKFWEDLKKALNTLNIDKEDFATHDFRRCFARRVWEKYKDIQVLQKLLNHEDPKTTMRYLQNSGLQNIDYHLAMQSGQ